MMSTSNDIVTSRIEADTEKIRQAFEKECPSGYCSRRKFLSCAEKHDRQLETNGKSRYSVTARFIHRQNFRQTRKFFSAMFDIYDRNQDGKLDFDEYLYAHLGLTDINGDRIIEILYDFFDFKRKGFITKKDFNDRKKLAARVMDQYQKNHHDHLSYDEAFDAMDVDKDGKISKEEFFAWHAKQKTESSNKPVKKRKRLLRNLSTLVESNDEPKISSSQQNTLSDRFYNSSSVRTNENNHMINNQYDPELISIHTDRYFGKVMRRARNKFLRHRFTSSNSTDRLPSLTTETYSDSGFLTASPPTLHEDNVSNTLSDIDNDSLASNDIDDLNDNLFCQSLEAVLLETILELRRERERRFNSSHSSTAYQTTDNRLITRL